MFDVIHPRRLSLALPVSLLLGLLSAAVLAATPPHAETPPPNESGRIPDMAIGLLPPGYGVRQLACPTGADRCVDVVTREMTRHYKSFGCDHNAVFALLYLRTTEGIRNSIRAGYFLDRSLLNREATSFARFYLDPVYAWEQGRDTVVADAWRIAFEHAEDQALHAFGNMFLGINAHVNRDLPFVLYRLGMVRQDDGYAARYEDHMRVDDVLAMTRPIAFQGIALTLDNSIYIPGLLDHLAQDASFLNDPFLVPKWRQHAWEQAERLRDAPDAAARAAVAADIEAYAASVANEIVEATRYPIEFDGRTLTAESRNAYCASVQ